MLGADPHCSSSYIDNVERTEHTTGPPSPPHQHRRHRDPLPSVQEAHLCQPIHLHPDPTARGQRPESLGQRTDRES